MTSDEDRCRLLTVNGDPAIREFHVRRPVQRAQGGCDSVGAGDVSAAQALMVSDKNFGFLPRLDVSRCFNRAVTQDADRTVRPTPLLPAECRTALTRLEDLVCRSRIQPP